MTRPGRVLFLLAMSAQAAWAASTTYFDRTAFTNATQSLQGVRQSIQFDPWADLRPPNLGYDFGPTVTISNVTFAGGILVARTGGWSDSGAVLFNYDSGGPMTIHFGDGARAFGANFSSDVSRDFSSFTATISLGNGEIFSFTAQPTPNYTFFGFISDSPIRDLTFSDGGILNIGGGFFAHEEVIGNIFMVAEVPEPGTVAFVLLIGAVWAFVGRARRRRGRGSFATSQ